MDGFRLIAFLSYLLLQLAAGNELLARDSFFIFVGGRHLTGTSVTERILSSQPFASGIEVTETTVLKRVDTCRRPNEKKSTCFIQEHEGCYLTKQFEKLSMRLHGQINYQLGFVGDWPTTFRDRFKEAHLSRLNVTETVQLRQKLLSDWGLGWDFSKKYLVEKDIENAVRSTFLQGLFGRNQTAFVFVLRHPMASCKYFRCSVENVLLSWLNLYETMERDLEKLENYVVFHSEALVSSPDVVMEALAKMLNWPKIRYNFEPKLRRKMLQLADDDFAQRDVSRKLPYKQFGSDKEIVTLSSSENTIRWNHSYYSTLMSDVETLNLLRYYKDRLQHFCYSIYNWKIHCDSPIFRMKVGVKWKFHPE